jgi:protein arginine kinase activator
MMQGMRSMLANPFSAFGGGLLDSFFGSSAPLLGDGSFFGEDLFDDFFTDMPALSAPEAETAPQTEQSAAPEAPEKPSRREIPISGEEQGRFSRLRQLNALRLELKKAVHQENFEHAAELRDQIRALEQERKNEN